MRANLTTCGGVSRDLGSVPDTLTSLQWLSIAEILEALSLPKRLAESETFVALLASQQFGPQV
jgi:hypothetical protein